MNTNNCLNRIFPFFDSLNSEFSPSFRLINTISSHFSFHWANYKDKESKTAYLCKLDDIFTKTLLDPKSVIVIVSDASIRNNVAMFILHIHLYSNNVEKTIHHAVNITFTKAELFSIRCGINQAIQILGAYYIILITNTIHLA